MVQDDYFSADEMPLQDRMNFQLIFATAIFHGQNSCAGFDMWSHNILVNFNLKS